MIRKPPIQPSLPYNYDPRAYPNNRVVMRPSEKFEAKAAGQNARRRGFLHVENVFGRQRRHRALQPAAIERVIGIGSYMQNKPNLLDGQMNVTSLIIADYENKSNWKLGQNKPNTNPLKPNFRKARMKLNFYLTNHYENKPHQVIAINNYNLSIRSPLVIDTFLTRIFSS